MRLRLSTTSCNKFCFCAQGEMDYLAAFNGIPSSPIDEWWDMDFVVRDAWLWRKAQLRIEFRYIRKSRAFGLVATGSIVGALIGGV